MTAFAKRVFLLLGLWVVLVGARLGAQSYAFSTLAGSATSGGCVDGIGAAARLNASELAVDAAGNVYFADWCGHTIRRISPGGEVTTIAGATNQPGSADGPVASARFREPSGIALDASGNLYVGDTGNRVLRKISAGVVTTMAGQVGVEGETDGTGAVARFSSLEALTVDGGGNVFLCDFRNGVALVRKVTPAGAVTTLLRGGSFSGSDSLGSFFPNGLAVDPAGNLFITDNYGHTIRKLTPAGALTVVAGTPGQQGSADGSAAVARLSNPRGIARAANGDFFFVDHSLMTLRRLAPDGTVTTIAGQPDERFRPAIADGVGGNARFTSARRPAVDPSGNLYLPDGDCATLVRKGVPTAEPAPPIVTGSPAQEMGLARNVGARSSVTFKAVAIGAAPLAFQWLKNRLPIPGATGTAFTLASTVQGDEGGYSVRVSNAQGSYTTQAVNLWVYMPAFDGFAARRSVPGGSFLWGIASGGGQLVAVGTGGRILTSVDGRAWTARESGTSEWLLGVTYGAGQYVVVGDHGTILVSRDAVKWQRATASGTLQRLNNVAFGNNRYVAVGEAGTIVSSSDAQVWTARASGVTSWLRGLVWEPSPSVRASGWFMGDSFSGGFRFYASGQGGVLLSSESGESWARPYGFPPPGLGNRDLEGLAGGPTGVGQDGAIVRLERGLMSSKGSPPITSWITSWHARELGLQARFRGIAKAADAIFVTGENGVVAAAPYVVGPWSFIPTGTTANLVSGVFHWNSLFVVGENETVLESQALYPTRLVNLATRGLVGAGESAMIGGFVVGGSVPKTVLLRAAGPALGAFGVPDFLGASVLTLFDGAGRRMATNAGWSLNANADDIAAAASQVGAFAFAGGSADAAMLMTLAPGAYTAQVTGQGGATGVALVEAYDTEPAGREGSRFINLSTRGRVGTDGNRMIAGFVLSGAASRRVLIRAVGPALAGFGLSGVLAEPKIELYAQRFGSAELRQTAGAWSLQPNADEIRSAALLAGAFALPEDSLDAALVADLLPGAYTVQISGVNNATGLAIVEVYDLP